MKYYTVVICKRNKNGEYTEKDALHFLNENTAEITHCATVCELSQQLGIPVVYSDFVLIGDYTVRLIKNLPVIYYNINNCDEVVKVSFNKNEIEQSINEMNNLGDNCHFEQYPKKFEDIE